MKKTLQVKIDSLVFRLLCDAVIAVRCQDGIQTAMICTKLHTKFLRDLHKIHPVKEKKGNNFISTGYLSDRSSRNRKK